MDFCTYIYVFQTMKPANHFIFKPPVSGSKTVSILPNMYIKSINQYNYFNHNNMMYFLGLG